MSTKPTHNAVYKAGTYTDAEGKERNAYRTIGAAWPDREGQLNRIQLETIPVAWDGVIYLRKREEASS